MNQEANPTKQAERNANWLAATVRRTSDPDLLAKKIKDRRKLQFLRKQGVK